MAKLIASYMLIFLLFAYFSSIAEGGGGIVATRLTAGVDEDDTILTVATTQGFLALDSVIINDEEIAYNGITAVQFQNCVRSHRGTTAEAHSADELVYSTGASVINRALGFNVISTGEAYGTLAVIGTTIGFLGKSIGYLVTFNFGILGGQLVYLRYLLMAPAVGFVVYMGFMAMGTLFGIIRK